MIRYRRLLFAAVTALAVLLMLTRIGASIPVHAQEAAGGTVLDGIYTTEQAERGKLQFAQDCAACHNAVEHSGGNFSSKWAGTTLNELFELMANTMPESEPGRLKPEEYASIVAFFLKESGYPEGQKDLPADVETLKKIRVVPPAK